MNEEPFSGAEPMSGEVGAIDEPVIVATHRIEPELLRDVRDACARAHARYVPWAGEVSLRDVRKAPAVLVTGLRVGERKIPDDVLDIATNAYPDLALLVLCREPLLRPTMSLNNGRVTLVSPPVTSPRIASALRGLLSDRHIGYASTDTATGLEAKSPVKVRTYRWADYWVGALSSARVEGEAPKLSTVRQTKTDGLTIVVPAPGSTATVDINAVAAAFKRDRSAADRAAALEEALGKNGGAIHLSPGADEWTVYWPNKQWPLHLSSPLRLPNVSNMARAMEQVGKNLLRLPAAHCDMIAALTRYPTAVVREGAPPPSDPYLTETMPALAEGGLALIDFLGRSLRDQPADFAGVVVEVF